MIVQKGALRVADPEGGLTVAAGVSSASILPQPVADCNLDPGDGWVVIADRRVGERFEVDQRVIDEWQAIIGLTGIGLYALYCRLAEGGVTPGRELWAAGGDVAHLHRLLQWCGLVLEAGDGAFLLPDPPERSTARLRKLETCLFNAVSCAISPVWTRALARVKRLLGRVAS